MSRQCYYYMEASLVSWVAYHLLGSGRGRSVSTRLAFTVWICGCVLWSQSKNYTSMYCIFLLRDWDSDDLISKWILGEGHIIPVSDILNWFLNSSSLSKSGSHEKVGCSTEQCFSLNKLLPRGWFSYCILLQIQRLAFIRNKQLQIKAFVHYSSMIYWEANQ